MNNSSWTAVQRQISAMGAHVYEVGLFKPRQPGDTSNEPEMLPRTWDRETLLRSVSWLRYQNAQGRNIYIRPYGEHHLSLVDDLTADAIKQMKSEGFTPAVVVETSPGNFQAWLNHGEVLPKQLSTLAARTLAERFGGDKSAADWRHFGRLSGLTNRKERHRDNVGRFPFVRLVESSGDPYSVRKHFLPDTRGTACSDGAVPLLKPVVARAGDRVVLSSDGIAVNGRLLPQTAPLVRDGKGRLLRAWPFGTYLVNAETVWVASTYSRGSYDSRYMGPINISHIRARLRPLWLL